MLIDDIKTEYHPNSGKGLHIHHFNDFSCSAEQTYTSLEDEPWRPFRCHTDFELVEIAIDASITGNCLDSLIKLIEKVKSGAEFTLKNAKDVANTWESASAMHTPVS